jgi:hypothetical protein
MGNSFTEHDPSHHLPSSFHRLEIFHTYVQLPPPLLREGGTFAAGQCCIAAFSLFMVFWHQTGHWEYVSALLYCRNK